MKKLTEKERDEIIVLISIEHDKRQWKLPLLTLSRAFEKEARGKNGKGKIADLDSILLRHNLHECNRPLLAAYAETPDFHRKFLKNQDLVQKTKRAIPSRINVRKKSGVVQQIFLEIRPTDTRRQIKKLVDENATLIGFYQEAARQQTNGVPSPERLEHLAFQARIKDAKTRKRFEPTFTLSELGLLKIYLAVKHFLALEKKYPRTESGIFSKVAKTLEKKYGIYMAAQTVQQAVYTKFPRLIPEYQTLFPDLIPKK